MARKLRIVRPPLRRKPQEILASVPKELETELCPLLQELFAQWGELFLATTKGEAKRLRRDHPDAMLISIRFLRSGE